MNNKSTYYLLGFGCGSLAGLLFAPNSGAATRAEIARAGKKRRRLIKKRMSSATAAIKSYKVGALRGLRRNMTLSRARALFQ